MHNKLNHALWARNHRRTLKGFLESKYTAMQKRVNGKDKNCLKTVAGLPILPREEFYRWARQQNNLYSLFETYQKSGWQFKLCPTINRINSAYGYVIGNIEFITQSKNAQGSCWNHKYSQTRLAQYQRERYRAGLTSRQIKAAKT